MKYVDTIILYCSIIQQRTCNEFEKYDRGKNKNNETHAIMHVLHYCKALNAKSYQLENILHLPYGSVCRSTTHHLTAPYCTYVWVTVGVTGFPVEKVRVQGFPCFI